MRRKPFSTTLDENLLRELKVAAARFDRPVNELLEEGARKVLGELATTDPDDRYFTERHHEPDEDILEAIEERLKQIRGRGGAAQV